MNYTIQAIPTRYKGRQYRSRLEARWAAFFDYLEWRVEYEPCDFNGWIPDFVILEHDTVFVEVKPVSVFPKDAANKIAISGCEEECIIAGISVPFPIKATQSLPFGFPAIGWLAEKNQEKDSWWDFGLFSQSYCAKRFGLFHGYSSYHCRITGVHQPWKGREGVAPHFQAFWAEHDLNDLIANMWAEAGNAVQWKPAGRKYR